MPPSPPRYDAVVLGAGAAGLMCAAVAGKRGRRVIMLERNAEPGAKILISGGGRCNFTNLHCAADRFFSENPHFAKSALAGFTARDFLALVERHKIAWYEKTLGQLFCEGAGSARKIVKMLLDECAAGGVEIRTSAEVGEVLKPDGFRIVTAGGAIDATALVLATGGLSIPKIGASGLSLRLAERFGLKLTETAPALVPLLLEPATLAWSGALAGVSAPVTSRAGGPAFEEALLFTHRGLSGPAVLQASTSWRAGTPLLVDFGAPDLLALKRARPKLTVRNALTERFPARLAEVFAAGFDGKLLADASDKALAALAAKLSAFEFLPVGDEGYAKAEVMRGGVSTGGLHQKTLEAKTVPGLFVIGEAVDVTGWLGGYNFQWAWASGYAAGQAL